MDYTYFGPGGDSALPRFRKPCLLAPPGWICSRDGGHDGPCAAKPDEPMQGMKFTFSAAGITIDRSTAHPDSRPTLLIDWQRIDEMRARFGPKNADAT